jgi:hypothetical protein
MDELERELRLGVQRQPAPASLKHRVMERRRQQRARQHRRMVWFERLAASLVLAGVAGGAAFWRHEVELRRGEEAKQQVFTALRITNHALQVMNAQLEERNKDSR